ncbi:family 78 glycoside hydrolase catalytic domain [Listeria costaricensis]|uniref:alpha-L-rhamnosidase-related protein n=1 Tax=Listeria costaricensis TaxID=2026604 RepID=UPI000C0860C9|nr:family 78 glycoside hydrolase catalytic domain [Listeria costaricensis]
MDMQINKEVKIIRNEAFLEKAEALDHPLFEEWVRPVRMVKMVADEAAIHGFRAEALPDSPLETAPLGKGDCVIFDFGRHLVGYPSFELEPVGSPPDAPLYFRLTFAEMPVEAAVDFSAYDGWLSKSWLQEDAFHIDVLPKIFHAERRYSFRYMKLEVIDSSPKYQVKLAHIKVRAVTSADQASLAPLHATRPENRQLDHVSLETLKSCMQSVYEDGPKRDRRLWLGDLYLQAQASYVSFQNVDLVKRCLYLFAGLPDTQGRVPANLFIAPEVRADDTYLVDYALYFMDTLYDYYQHTGEKETVRELWPTAKSQLNFAAEHLNELGIMEDRPYWWSFVDWNPDLSKATPTHGLYLLTLKRAASLAAEFEPALVEELTAKCEMGKQAARDHLYDAPTGFFRSGTDHQISWHSQIWMVLGEVVSKEEGRQLLLRTMRKNPEIGLTTPFAYHFMVEALFKTGLKEEAERMMDTYWGGMIKAGADTFWELFKPDDLNFSPYGSHLINSYCHAWSCTPTYFIRKYQL